MSKSRIEANWFAVSRPNILAVVLHPAAPVDAVLAANRELEEKGIVLAGQVELAQCPSPLVPSGLCFVYFTYRLDADEDILSPREAKFALKLAEAFRKRGMTGWVLGRKQFSALETMPELQAVMDRARQGDRDLHLEDDEVFIRDLSQNRIRSSIWLIRRGREYVVRKSYSSGSIYQLRNEIEARRVLRDRRVVEIIEQRGAVLYFPYIQGGFRWRGKLLEYFPRAYAQAVFDFLGDVARAGYSMIDINPSAFLFDGAAELKAVDFEFFARTRVAPNFVESADYAGRFDGIPAPKKNGYRRYWYDPLAGELDVVMAASPVDYGLRKVSHVLLHRIPGRVVGFVGATFQQLKARAVRLARLRNGCLRV